MKKINTNLEDWILLTVVLFLSIVGIGGFLICSYGEMWLGLLSCKGAFLAFGVYGLFHTYMMIKYWDV